MDLLSSTLHQAAQEELNACLWSPSEPIEFALDPTGTNPQVTHAGGQGFHYAQNPHHPQNQQHLIMARKASQDMMAAAAMTLPTPTTPMDLSGQLESLVKADPNQVSSQQQQQTHGQLSIITTGLPTVSADALNAPLPLSAPVVGRPMPLEFMGFPTSGHIHHSFPVLTSPAPHTAHPFFVQQHQHHPDLLNFLPTSSPAGPPSAALSSPSSVISMHHAFPSPGTPIDFQGFQPPMPVFHRPLSPMSAFMSQQNTTSFSSQPALDVSSGVARFENWNHQPMTPMVNSGLVTPPSSSPEQENSQEKRARKRAKSAITASDLDRTLASRKKSEPTKSFPCTHEGCSLVFTKFQNLKSHLRLHNSSEKTFACELCSLAFRRKHDLSRHYRSLHATVKSYECTLCNKAYARSDALKRHVASRAHIENAASHMNSVAQESSPQSHGITQGPMVSSPKIMENEAEKFYAQHQQQQAALSLPTVPSSPVSDVAYHMTQGIPSDFPMPVYVDAPPMMIPHTSFSLASLASPVLQSPLQKELHLPLDEDPLASGSGKRRRTVSEPKLVPKKLLHLATSINMPSIAEDPSFS